MYGALRKKLDRAAVVTQLPSSRLASRSLDLAFADRRSRYVTKPLLCMCAQRAAACSTRNVNLRSAHARRPPERIHFARLVERSGERSWRGVGELGQLAAVQEQRYERLYERRYERRPARARAPGPLALPNICSFSPASLRS